MYTVYRSPLTAQPSNLLLTYFKSVGYTATRLYSWVRVWRIGVVIAQGHIRLVQRTFMNRFPFSWLVFWLLDRVGSDYSSAKLSMYQPSNYYFFHSSFFYLTRMGPSSFGGWTCSKDEMCRQVQYVLLDVAVLGRDGVLGVRLDLWMCRCVHLVQFPSGIFFCIPVFSMIDLWVGHAVG